MTTFMKDDFSDQYQIAAFYSFSPLSDESICLLLNQISSYAEANQIKGIVLFASEGINGTICGKKEAVDSLIRILTEQVKNNGLEIKYSWSKRQAFRRFKTRQKEEIVTMGVKDINPNKVVGKYIEPRDWNALIDAPSTLVIDTRNEYEISVGTFEGAVNPHTDIFREFPKWVDEVLRPLINKRNPKEIALFCTGGIRCEKATSYLRTHGFTNVNHLHGGILRYLEEVPQSESRWQGECFVFDQRVALNHELTTGTYLLCHACGMPLSIEDREKSNYIRGIQCHYCEERFTDIDRARFAQRQEQIDELSERLPGNLKWPNA
tara:strand:+ start:2140 stop:3102 length:963 start_codon:yes stop_codon:yes gene_type:complete